MARYLSGNPVLQSQRYLADTLRQGISDMSQRPLDMARFGLMEKQTLSDVAHRQRGDERADLAEQRAGEMQAQNILESKALMEDRAAKEIRAENEASMKQSLFEAGKTGRIADEMQAQDEVRRLTEQGNQRKKRVSASGMLMHMLGDDPSRESTTDMLSDDKLSQILEITGGELAEETNPETGLKQKYFKRKDGSYLEWGQFKNVMPAIETVFEAGADPYLRAKQKIRQTEKMMGTKGALPPEEAAALEKFKKIIETPQWKLEQNEKLQNLSLDKLAKFQQMGQQTPLLNAKFKKRANKIAGLKATVSASAEHGRKIELEKLKSGGKFTNKLSEQKYNAYAAFLNGTATPEQIRAFGLDKDMYLAQAAKLINDDIENLDEKPEEKMQRIIELAETMRSAATKTGKNDPDDIRKTLFK
jgi:hypothetical protein